MSGSLGIWALANKPSVALQDPNASLASLALAKNNLMQAQGAQQDLDDRTTLRSLAGGLTTRDPSALGTAASLGSIGTGAITSLSTMDHNQAVDRLALMNADGQMYRVRPGLGGAPGGGGLGGTPGTGAPPDPNAPLSVPDVTPDAALNSIQDPAARDLVAKTAGTLGMDPKAIPFWVASLHNESGGSPRLNLQDGHDGEIGPGQIMPATGASMGYSQDQLRDPATNLMASGQYFAKQWQAANGDGVGAMRGYNGGNPGNLKAHGYAVAGVGRMNTWVQPAGGSGGAPQPGQPTQLNPQYASNTGTAGMPQTATDAGAGGAAPAPAASPAQPGQISLLSVAKPPAFAPPARPGSLASLPIPPIPPAGGPPPLPVDNAITVDTPEAAQSMPRGTQYRVGNGPLLTRASGPWSPTSDLPGYTAGGVPGPDGVVPGGAAPEPSVLAALGLGGAASAAPAPRSDLAAAAAPAAGTPHQILANAPQGPSSVAAQSIPRSATASGLNQQPMPAPAPQGAVPGVSLASLPGVMPAAASTPVSNAPQTLGQIGAAAVQLPNAPQPTPAGAGGQLVNAPLPPPMPQGAVQSVGGQGGMQPGGGLPPGAVFLTNRLGEYSTKGLPDGMAMAQLADGRVAPMPIPGAQKLVQKEVPGALINVNPFTGQEVSRIAIPDNRRTTIREGSDGGTVLIGGQPNGVVLPPNTRPQQAALLQDDYKQVPALSQAARSQEDLITKSIEMRDAAKGLPTGYGGEGRAQIASFLQTYAPDAAKAFAAGGSLPDAAQAEQAAKMMMQQSALNEKANGGSGGLGLTEMYAKNNPNLNMQPDSIRNMSNLAAVTAMSQKDYLQGKLDHIDNQGRAFLNGQPGADGRVAPYTPAAAYDRAWFSQDNTNTYMGAVNAMNGKPFAEWSKGLSPQNAQRALGVVARIDPTATVLGRNGHPLPVASFAPQNMSNPSGAGAR